MTQETAAVIHTRQQYHAHVTTVITGLRKGVWNVLWAAGIPINAPVLPATISFPLLSVTNTVVVSVERIATASRIAATVLYALTG